MREDNGVFRNFNYYKIKIAEMSIVLADYLQHKACARHGPAHLPRQLLAELLQPPCEAEVFTSSENTELHAQTTGSKVSNSHRAPQSFVVRLWIHIQGYGSAEQSKRCFGGAQE